MSAQDLDEAIRHLERQIETLKASKPAHDFTGAYERQLLELEDELDEKRKARAERNDGHV
jgi:hypothetical protein